MTAMQGNGVPSLKMDPDSKPGEGWIKSEPNLVDISPTLQADEDIYEDTGDLDFKAASQCLYLTRIPKMLWESWSKLNEDQEIVLGRMSLLLEPEVAQQSVLPQEYLLQITNPIAANTFVFSEKDLPGYTPNLRATPKLEDASTPSLAQRSPFQGRSRYGPQGIEKNRRSQGRRGVPKQTALAGRIQKEIKCLPVDNQSFKRAMDFRAKMEKEKKTTGFDKGVVSTTNVGQAFDNSFATFIKTSKVGKKSQKLKAARMPENELMDAIFGCFKQYEFWPWKSLLHAIRQPESYLREKLEEVAHLVKGGKRNGKWQLKPASERIGNYVIPKAEDAPEVASPRMSDIEVEEADEENVEMEDVLI